MELKKFIPIRLKIVFFEPEDMIRTSPIYGGEDDFGAGNSSDGGSSDSSGNVELPWS